MTSPFVPHPSRPHASTAFDGEEVRLANRNHGLALELMHHDITPMGMHYLLNHFDIPHLQEQDFRLEVSGQVARPVSMTLGALKARKNSFIACHS